MGDRLPRRAFVRGRRDTAGYVTRFWENSGLAMVHIELDDGSQFDMLARDSYPFAIMNVQSHRNKCTLNGNPVEYWQREFAETL